MPSFSFEELANRSACYTYSARLVFSISDSTIYSTLFVDNECCDNKGVLDYGYNELFYHILVLVLALASLYVSFGYICDTLRLFRVRQQEKRAISKDFSPFRSLMEFKNPADRL